MLFDRNIALRGGVAPVRAYIPELLPDILDGTIDPSPVFDLTIGLEGVPDGYRAMDGRTALKVLVTTLTRSVRLTTLTLFVGLTT